MRFYVVVLANEGWAPVGPPHYFHSLTTAWRAAGAARRCTPDRIFAVLPDHPAPWDEQLRDASVHRR